MSKKKSIYYLLFTAFFLCFSILWFGVFPLWSKATQSVIGLQDSVGASMDQYLIDNDSEPLIAIHEQETTIRELGKTERSPNSVSDQGEYPGESLGNRFNEKKSPIEKELSQSEQNLIRSEESLSEPEEPQSSPLTKQPESEQRQIIATIQNEDLLPTPLPGLPSTPIHPYYDEKGNPPTAPGLAMRQRKFKLEGEKMAYLTFDDGPYPSTTPRILDILAEEQIQATFFNIGCQMELYPELLKAEHEQGHAIGNHSYSHNMTEVYKSPEHFLADVKKAEEVIFDTVGIRPQIVRAPGGTAGHFNIKFFNSMDAEGYLMEDWNVDPGDTRTLSVTAQYLVQQVEEQIQGKNRVVILLHDLVGKDTTIEALPGIIKTLKEQGFSFGVLGPDVVPIVFSPGLKS